MTAAAGIICTAAKDCKAASSCCQGFSKSSTGTPQSTAVKVCWAAGSAAKAKQTITVQTGITTADLDSGSGYLFGAACAAATTGASTLALSAAAAATAVYMM